MSNLAFSLVTAIFTIGGLAGSLVANLVMDKYGRHGTHRLCAILVVIGTAVMGLSTSVFALLLGRYVRVSSEPYTNLKKIVSDS